MRNRLLSNRRDLSPLFADTPDVELLDYGVPPEWVEEVKLATEESLLELTDHLPVEAAEALLELATGGKPHGLVAVPALVDPFEHPDAQRRFRVMNNVEELERPRFPLGELDGLPSPRTAPAGRARFHGSRSCFWFGRHRQDGCSATPSRSSCAFEPRLAVLLTTFSDPLANALLVKIRRLLANEPRLGETIDVYSINSIGLRLHKAHIGPAKLASREIIRSIIDHAAKKVEDRFGTHFLYRMGTDRGRSGVGRRNRADRRKAPVTD